MKIKHTVCLEVPADTESHAKVVARYIEGLNGICGTDVFHNVNVCHVDGKYSVSAYHEPAKHSVETYHVRLASVPCPKALNKIPHSAHWYVDGSDNRHCLGWQPVMRVKS